jgi:hypothetical protein
MVMLMSPKIAGRRRSYGLMMAVCIEKYMKQLDDNIG